MTAPPKHARADVKLVWNAPAGCPGGAMVEERMRTIAGKSMRASAPLRAEGRITRVGARYRLTLIVRDGHVRRQRIIYSESCVDLAGAAAIALGLLLRNAPNDETTSAPADSAATSEDRGQTATTPAGESPSSNGESPSLDNSRPAARQSSLSSRNSDGPRALAPEDEVPESPGRAALVTVESPVEERNTSLDGQEWRFVIRAPLLAIDVGPLPTPVSSLGAGVGIRHGPWHVTAVARVFQDETVWSPVIPEVGARVEHREAELWTCRAWSGRRFDLAPCLTLGLNRLTVAGTGPGVTPRARQSTSLTVGVAGAAHLRLFDWMALVGVVGAGLETTRPRFLIEGLGEAGRWGPARISVGVGAEWIL